MESKPLLSGYFEKHSQGLSQKLLLSAYSDFSAEPSHGVRRDCWRHLRTAALAAALRLAQDGS